MLDPIARICLTACLVLAAPGLLRAEFWGYNGTRRQFDGMVWSADLPQFGEAAYQSAVEGLLRQFEEQTGRRLEPGAFRRAGLKLYTNSGPGLATPHPLTKAVIEELVKRGFERGELFLIDYREDRLRQCGYLPPLSAFDEPDEYLGVPVYALDSGEHFDPAWFYDNPLPREFTSPLARELIVEPMEGDSEMRRSYLNTEFLYEIDFWINLPMVTDHFALGLNGTLVNGTLWNMGNSGRFMVSRANGPIAVAEVAAIPELRASWALSLLSLERYQFIAGPQFNSLYTQSEPRLLMAVDPVILDAMMVARVNRERERMGFDPMAGFLPLIDYAVQLGLGFGLVEQVQRIAVSVSDVGQGWNNLESDPELPK